jgi:hypothetical protein
MYGAQIVVLTCLSAMTVYRRELSSNRVFHQEKEVTEQEKSKYRPRRQVSEKTLHQTDELLESAGSYCSGAPLLAIISVWLECFDRAEHEQEPILPPKLLLDEITPSDLLDRVGNYYSGEPIIAAIAYCFLSKAESSPSAGLPINTHHCHPFTKELPPDVHVYITSFLHPKDVVNLACVNKNYQAIMEGEASMAIWKCLWYRDYAWIVKSWDVGQLALQRSAPKQIHFDKDFYFLFGQAYMGYVLAGQNTPYRCLVGIHSNIYDITPFLDIHPGSPDTLMVHSGKDATAFFEDMSHSMRARRLARSLCVVVDAFTYQGGCGLHPTPRSVLADRTDALLPPLVQSSDNLSLGRNQRTGLGTLSRIRTQYVRDYEQLRRQVDRKFASDTSVLGQVNHYFDPFHKEWRIWYTNTDLDTVFQSL